jgi:predicted metal-binding membrane protein
MGLLPLTLLWFGMMGAMMAPAVWPWIRAAESFGVRGSGVSFASGYLIAWLGYSVGSALLQTLVPMRGAAVGPRAGAIIFLIAGLYQFAPLKRACLTHCRTPIGYFLTRWRNGPVGAMRMGLHHGLFCVGCCWALMATAFAVGVMNLWWMAALGAVALGEQIAPHGHILRRSIGAAFLAAAVGWAA